jgi:hypothetical protein
MVNGGLANSEEHSGQRAIARQRAFGALIRTLAGLKKIPGSLLRGAPE